MADATYDSIPHWHTAGRKWLQETADRAFAAWLTTNAGRGWKETPDRQRRRLRTCTGYKLTPYQCGFYLPGWHDEAIKALDAGDEMAFKAIRLNHEFMPQA